jgi:hypothetical protein
MFELDTKEKQSTKEKSNNQYINKEKGRKRWGSLSIPNM